MQSQAGTLLVNGGLLTELQLKQALSTTIQVGGSLVQNAIRLGFVNSRQVATFFADRLQVPLVEESQLDNLPVFITRLVPADLVMEHRAIPIMLHQGVLHLAMSDPTNRSALEEISFNTGYSASPVAAMDEQVELAMARYYGIPPDQGIKTPADVEPLVKKAAVNQSQRDTSPMFAEGPPTMPPPVEEETPLEAARRGKFLAPEPARPKKEDPDQAETKPTLEVYEPPTEDEDGELERFFRSAREDLEQQVLDAKQTSPSSLGAALAGLGDEPVQQLDHGHRVEPREQAAADADEDDSLAPLHDVEFARRTIQEAKDRDEVARALVRYGRTLMSRCLIFIVKRDLLVGWLGAGEQIDPKQVKGIMIPLGSPSVFRTVRETGSDYFGSLPHTTVNDIFQAALGDIETRQVLLIPIAVRHKPICILYGDAGSSEGFSKDLSSVHLLAQDAAQAFERIIIDRKMGRVVTR